MIQTVLLYLHIMGAIIAFGPSFVFPLIGNHIGKHPRNATFGVELMEIIETRLILPVAVFMLISGAALWWHGGYSPLTVWLDTALVLYVIAMGIATGVLLPNSRKTLQILAAMPAGGPPPGAPAGPPPELAARMRTGQVGGMVLTVLLFAIAALMVFKPFS